MADNQWTGSLGDLLAELTVERYGPLPTEPGRLPEDSAILRERRRVLCEALDEPLADVIPLRRAA